MTILELQRFHSQPISYRIADQVGSGIIFVQNGKVSITASSSDNGIEGVEPIRLTEHQFGAIVLKDGVLTLEA